MAKPLVLPEEQVLKIQSILDELQGKCKSDYVFLADVSGQLIQARGRIGSMDIVALAALTASNMAATTEMAKRMGEAKGFRLLFHEGEHENIYLSHVGASFMLAVVFSSDVQIGLVRLFSKRAVEELAALAEAYESTVASGPSIMDADFGAALDQELDRLLPS